MKKLILSTTLLFVILFSACKKDEPENATRTELLTNGSWVITAFMSDEDANGTYEINDYALIPNCIKDNYYTFKTNFELETNEGATKCSSTDPQIFVLLWNFSNSETVLVIDTDAQNILELTATTLKLKQDNGLNTSSIITFTKR